MITPSTNTINNCPSYHEIKCNIAKMYPFCDMTCPMNKDSKRILEGGKRSEKERT